MFRVAKDLGKTVYQLSNEMSNYELAEWGYYYERIEPRRVSKQDLYLAQIAYVAAGSSKLKTKDFLLKFRDKDDNLIKIDGKQMAQLFMNAFKVKDKK